MELIKLIGEYLLQFYTFYAVSIKSIVTLIFPSIAIPLLTGMLIHWIPISVMAARIYSVSFSKALFMPGYILFNFLMTMPWLYITENANIGYTNKEQIGSSGAGLFWLGLIILGMLQENAKINQFAIGFKRSQD